MIKAHKYHFALDKCTRGIIEGRGQGVAGARARMEAQRHSQRLKGAKRARGKFKFCYWETVVILQPER